MRKSHEMSEKNVNVFQKRSSNEGMDIFTQERENNFWFNNFEKIQFYY